MADKIDQITIGSTSYDIDLPPDATPSISGLTVSGNVSDGTTTKTMTQLLAGGGGGLTLLYAGYCTDIDGSTGTEIGNSGLYAISGYIEDLASLIGASHLSDKLFIEVIDGNGPDSTMFPLTPGDSQYNFYGIWDTTIDYAIQAAHDEMNIYKLG